MSDGCKRMMRQAGYINFIGMCGCFGLPKALLRRVQLILVAVCVLLSPLALTPASGENATSGNAITGIRLGHIKLDTGNGLRVVVEQAEPIVAQLFILDNPYRLVIDSPNTVWDIKTLPRSGTLDIAPARAYRFGVSEAKVGRLVIEFDAPAAPLRAFTLPPRKIDGKSGGHRLVIDLVDRGPTAFRVAQAALRKQPFIAEQGEALPANAPAVQLAKPATATPLPRPFIVDNSDAGPTISGKLASIATPVPRPHRWIVVIDAGHGGKDPGALGGRGTREKDVTLKAAKALAIYLNQTGKVAARLTRDRDRFIHLRQRIKIARDQRADLFISLHADAAQSKRVYGLSVFSLSEVASDKEAAFLAKQGDQADLIGGPDLSKEDSLAANELLRMFQRESMNESAYLAKAILKEVRDLRGGTKRGHRFAGFAVLKSPDVPSVLVEMGFLTNNDDEKNLRRDAYLKKIATRLGRAIITYLDQSGR